MSTSIVFSAELWGKFKKKQDTLHEIKEKYAVNIENPNISDYKTFIHIDVPGSSAKSLSAKEKLIADFELFNKPKPPKAPSQKSRRSTDVLVSIGKWEKYKDEYRALASEHNVDLNSGIGSTKDFRVVQIQPRMNARVDVQSVRDLILQKMESSPYSKDYAGNASKSQQYGDQLHHVSDTQHIRQHTGTQDSIRDQTTTNVYQYQHAGTEKDHSGIYADLGTHDSNLRNFDNEAMWKGNRTDRNIARDIISTQAVKKFATDKQSGIGSKITMHNNEPNISYKGNDSHSYMAADSGEQLRPSSHTYCAEQAHNKPIPATQGSFEIRSANQGNYSGSRKAEQSKMPKTDRGGVDVVSFEDQPIDRKLFEEANNKAYSEFLKKYQPKMSMFRRDDHGRYMLSLNIYSEKDKHLRNLMNTSISKMFQTYCNYLELRDHGLKIDKQMFVKINQKRYSNFKQRYGDRVTIERSGRDLLFIKIHDTEDNFLRPEVAEYVLEMYDKYLDEMGTPG